MDNISQDSQGLVDKKCCLYVKNFGETLSDKKLFELFSNFGHVTSAKVKRTPQGKSCGYGFVVYSSSEEVAKALKSLNGYLLKDQKLYVNYLQTKDERSIVLASHFLLQGTNLIVQNLHESVDDLVLHSLFSHYGLVTSAKVNTNEGKSLGFGFVCYSSPESAQNAIKEMNGRIVQGKKLTVKVHEKKAIRQKGTNLRISNLDSRVDDRILEEEFQRFGKILSSKVMFNSLGVSKNYGYVCYSSPEEAQCAIQHMHNKWLGSKALSVTVAESQNDQQENLSCRPRARSKSRSSGAKHITKETHHNNCTASGTEKENTIIVKNMDSWMTKDTLHALFSRFGTIVHAQVSEKGNEFQRCSGLVTFTSRREAEEAIWGMNKCPVGPLSDHCLEVELYSPHEENDITRKKRPLISEPRFESLSSDEDDLSSEDGVLGLKSNLYVKNLHPQVDGEKLKQVFSHYGTVISASVAKTKDGMSRRFGFVNFSTNKEANLALEQMNSYEWHGKPLFVAFHQTKAERKEFMEEQLKQRVQNLAQKSQDRNTSLPRQRVISHSDQGDPSVSARSSSQTGLQPRDAQLGSINSDRENVKQRTSRRDDFNSAGFSSARGEESRTRLGNPTKQISFQHYKMKSPPSPVPGEEDVSEFPVKALRARFEKMQVEQNPCISREKQESLVGETPSTSCTALPASDTKVKRKKSRPDSRHRVKKEPSRPVTEDKHDDRRNIQDRLHSDLTSTTDIMKEVDSLLKLSDQDILRRLKRVKKL